MGMTVFDLEADGLNPTKIHCTAYSGVEEKEVFSTTDYEKMCVFYEGSEILIGHNIIRFDIPVVKRLLKVDVKAKLVDTLILPVS